MARPLIFWHWQNLPSNRDEVQPLAIEKMKDGSEVTLFYNKTTERLFFEYDGSYGVLIQGDKDETKASARASTAKRVQQRD